MSGDSAGGGIGRRGPGGGMPAPVPFAGAATAGGPEAGRSGRAGSGSGRPAPTLRRGSPARAGLLAEPLERLVSDAERFLEPSPAHPWYAGAVLLAGRGDTVALHRAIGSAVRYSAYDETTDTGVEFPADRQIATAGDTVFDLASVSKLFTSILAVRQIERGALALEERVASYLPEFGGAGKQDMTIRQLLTHTSGFAAWIPLYREPTRERMLQRLWDEAPTGPPGSVYRYSDLNLISLQLVLERITGRGLDVQLREEITAPLGMRRTRFNPPASWKPGIAATEDCRRPWAGLDRGLVWGEVHDENAFGLGGVAGHAGIFSCAWDLAILARALLNGGAYGRVRILRPSSVELMFTDLNTEFPGDGHGLGFELYQHWYMGAMATPRTAGHTGFTGTSLVLDPTTDSFLIVLGNSVHPARGWRSGSAPRVAAADQLARAVAVTRDKGRRAWFSGMAAGAIATLALPSLRFATGQGRLRCSLWWDTEPVTGELVLEVREEGDGDEWRPVPFTTTPSGREAGTPRPTGSVSGWSGRVWHRLHADLTVPRDRPVRLRWRYVAGGPYVGRGAYVDGLRVTDGGRTVFDDTRHEDAGRVESDGWSRSAD